MTYKRCIEKTIKYLGKYIRGQNLKTKTEILEVKSIREQLNGLMYEISKYKEKNK